MLAGTRPTLALVLRYLFLFSLFTASALAQVEAPTPVATVVNVRDHGATGDGATDDGPAVQAALDAANAIGAPATVFFPPGKYRVATPVTVNMSAAAQSHLLLEGVGSSSHVIFAVASTQTAFTFTGGNLTHVTFRKLAFSGAQPLHRGITFSSVLIASVEDAHFYGVQVAGGQTWGGTIFFTDSRLVLRGSTFRGCGGGYLAHGGVVTGYLWRGLDAEGLEFLDYGTLNGQFYNIASSPDAWIRLGNVRPPFNSWDTGGYAYIRNVVSDEGAPSTLRAYTEDGSLIQNVDVSNWRANNGVLNGFWFHNVNNATVRNSQVGYKPSLVGDGFPAVLATNVEKLNVERSEFLFNSNAISLRGGVKTAVIADTTYKHLENTGGAQVTITEGGVLVGGNSPGVTSFNARTGPVTLTRQDVTGALGYTPLNRAGDTITGPLVFGADAGRISTAPAGLHIQGASPGWLRPDLFVRNDGAVGIGATDPVAGVGLEVRRGPAPLPAFNRAGGVFRVASSAGSQTNAGVVGATTNVTGTSVTSAGVYGYSYEQNGGVSMGVRGRGETSIYYDATVYGGLFEGVMNSGNGGNRTVYGAYTSATFPGNSVGLAYGLYSKVVMSSTQSNVGAWGVYSSVNGAGSSSPLYGFFADVVGGTGPKFSFYGKSGIFYNAERVGIGTTAPKSELHVATGYVQLPLTAGAPPAADCDHAEEYGRMKIDAASARMYVCTAGGWKSAALQ